MSALRWAGRTRVTLCAALVVMAMGIASCSGASGAAKPSGAAGGFKPGVLDRTYAGTTINVLVPAWAAQPAASIAKFTAATGIVVKQETLDFNAVHDKIVTSESAGQAPADVTEMDWTWVSQFGAAGWLQPAMATRPAHRRVYIAFRASGMRFTGLPRDFGVSNDHAAAAFEVAGPFVQHGRFTASATSLNYQGPI